jgi:hypothetical protein
VRTDLHIIDPLGETCVLGHARAIDVALDVAARSEARRPGASVVGDRR